MTREAVSDETVRSAVSGRKAVRNVALVLVALAVAAAVGWRALVSRDARAARDAVASGRYDDAEAAIGRWLRDAPGTSEPLLLGARVAIARGRLPQAIELYERAKTKWDAGQEVELVGAILAAKVGRLDQAGPVLSRAFLEPRGPDPLLDEALAKVYLETYDFLRALTVIERWIVDAPRDPKPYLWRTEINARRGDQTALLIDDYREALRRDPGLAQARLGLADQLRKVHRGAEASAEYAAYLRLRPDDVAGHLGAGLNAMEVGDEAAATRHLERAVALGPENAQALAAWAGAAVRGGDAEAALSRLDRAAALDPYDLPIRVSRALVLTRLGRKEAARAEQVVASRLRADSEVLTSLQSRLFLAPNDPELQLQIARWLLDHGRQSAGVEWAEKILRETPGQPGAGRLLAEYYRSRGNLGLARFYQLDAGHGPDGR